MYIVFQTSNNISTVSDINISQNIACSNIRPTSTHTTNTNIDEQLTSPLRQRTDVS